MSKPKNPPRKYSAQELEPDTDSIFLGIGAWHRFSFLPQFCQILDTIPETCGVYYEHMRKWSTNIRLTLTAALVACGIALGFAPSIASAAETEALPLLMIVVEFDGGDDPEQAVLYDDGYDWGALLFGEGNTPASYYRDMSNGQFTFVPARETSATGIDGNTNVADSENDGIIHITVHRPHGAWGAVNFNREITREFALETMDIFAEAGNYVDFSAYDADGDGVLAPNELAICLCIAGYEAASVTNYERDDVPLLWSHSGVLSCIDQKERTIDGLEFKLYIAIAEKYCADGESFDAATQEPLGTIYHELGHTLGLPDLYPVDVKEGTWDGFSIGALSLMATGGWQELWDEEGPYSAPTAMDAWSRYVLGWTEPTIVTRSGDYRVSSELSDYGYSQVIVPSCNPDEYFLIENRLVEGHDIGLSVDYDGPTGVIVWHIDNGLHERYYDANQMNDADHHPAVMPANLGGESAVDLRLYNAADDVPEACLDAGISVSFENTGQRDVVVHVEIDDSNDPRDAFHLVKDVACEDLSLSPYRDPVSSTMRVLLSYAQ